MATLHIDGRNNAFTLAGTASSRTSLVEFEDHLRQVSWASGVDAPRDNLLKATSPAYRFTIHVDPEKIGPVDNASPVPQP